MSARRTPPDAGALVDLHSAPPAAEWTERTAVPAPVPPPPPPRAGSLAHPAPSPPRRRYFLRKLHKVKKAIGQIIAVNEIFERNPTTVKNFGIWVRYTSRSGVTNAYKEYRDTTLNGAVEQLYTEMGSRHRVRQSAMQIIKTATVVASACKRVNTQQFHDSKIKFPLTRRMARPSARVFKTTFKAVRPSVAIY